MHNEIRLFTSAATNERFMQPIRILESSSSFALVLTAMRNETAAWQQRPLPGKTNSCSVTGQSTCASMEFRSAEFFRLQLQRSPARELFSTFKLSSAAC